MIFNTVMPKKILMIIFIYLISLTVIGSTNAKDRSISSDFKQASYLFSSKEYDKALEKYKKILISDNKNCDILNKIVACYIKLGQFDMAMNYIEKAKNIDENFSTTYFYEAKLLIITGKFQDALIANNKAIKLSANKKPEYLITQGIIYHLLGQDDKAKESYEYVLSTKKNDPMNILYTISLEYFYDGDYKIAIYLLDYLISKEKLGRFYNSRSLTYSALGELEKALDDITTALAIEPKNALFLCNRAIIYRKIGNYSLAEKDLELAYIITPGDNELIYQFGVNYLYAGNYKKSLEYLEKYFELGNDDPQLRLYKGLANLYCANYNEAKIDLESAAKEGLNDFYLYYNLGIVNLKLENINDALESFLTASKIDPENYQSFMQLSFIYSILKDFEQTKKYSDIAIKLCPSCYHVYAIRGKALLNLGQFHNSLKDLTIAINNFDKDSSQNYMMDVYGERAMCYLFLKENAKALIDFEHIHKISKEPIFTIYYNKAILLGESGKYQEAIDLLNRAIELNQNEGGLYNNIGIYYAKLYKYHESYKNYDKAIKLMPDSPTAYYNYAVDKYHQTFYKEALLKINTAIEKRNNIEYQFRVTDYYVLKAKILFELKRYQDALSTIESALKLKPELKEAKEIKQKILKTIETI